MSDLFEPNSLPSSSSLSQELKTGTSHTPLKALQTVAHNATRDLHHRSAPFKLQDIGQNYVRVPDGSGGERLARVDAVLEGPCVFIRVDPETGSWPFLLRNDSDYPIEFYQAVSGLASRASLISIF